MAEEVPPAADAKRCVELMHEVAPVPLRLIELLDLPEKLFVLGGGELSLSSEPSEGLGELVAALAACRRIPGEFCAYGLLISRRASNVFCTLADRRRRIIVMHSVANTMSDYRSWESFACAIENAATIVAAVRDQGDPFEFVINKESAIRIVRP